MNSLVNKFCNLLMKSGNKSKAQALFFNAFTLFIKIALSQEPGQQSLKNQSPLNEPKKPGVISKKNTITSRGTNVSGVMLFEDKKSHAVDSKYSTIMSNHSKKQDAKYMAQKTLQAYKHIKCNDHLLNVSSKDSPFILHGGRSPSVKALCASSKMSAPYALHKGYQHLGESTVLLPSVIPKVKAHKMAMKPALKNANAKTTSLSRAHLDGLLDNLVENVRPCVEIRKVRKARITHQVPAQISKPRGQTVALRWIIELSHKRKQKEKITFAHALALELGSAHAKVGGARQRCIDLHRLAQANHGNMHFRWW